MNIGNLAYIDPHRDNSQGEGQAHNSTGIAASCPATKGRGKGCGDLLGRDLELKPEGAVGLVVHAESGPVGRQDLLRNGQPQP